MALGWQRDGATWIHLVDLDAAYGRGSNAEQLATIVGSLEISVELSGGIHDDRSLHTALRTGCARVNLSTAALADFDWCTAALAQHGERIAVSLDVRGSRLAARGSAYEGGGLVEQLERLDRAGCRRYVVTDVARDGALSGPNLSLLRSVCALTDAAVIASGGVASLDDLLALAALVPLGLEGVIVGSALHTGAFTLVEALDALASSSAEPSHPHLFPAAEPGGPALRDNAPERP